MNLSSTLFCLCFNSVEVVTSPMSVNASIGDVKVFSCVGFGEYFFWRANGKSVDGKKGFSDNGTEFNNDMIIHTTILTVNTSFVTNRTIITCIVAQLSPTRSEDTSDPAVILLQGTIPLFYSIN